MKILKTIDLKDKKIKNLIYKNAIKFDSIIGFKESISQNKISHFKDMPSFYPRFKVGQVSNIGKIEEVYQFDDNPFNFQYKINGTYYHQRLVTTRFKKFGTYKRLSLKTVLNDIELMDLYNAYSLLTNPIYEKDPNTKEYVMQFFNPCLNVEGSIGLYPKNRFLMTNIKFTIAYNLALREYANKESNLKLKQLKEPCLFDYLCEIA